MGILEAAALRLLGVIVVGLVLLIVPVRNGLHAYVYGYWTNRYVSFLRNFWVSRFGSASKYWLADHERCMGCAVCEAVCLYKAVSLRRDLTKPPPLDVRSLS